MCIARMRAMRSLSWRCKQQIARFTPQDARDYEESIKVYRDLTNVVNTAEQKGENRRALVIAQEMKKDGMSNTLIAKYTGLSIKQIEQL